ncbi:MAG: T9SS type A sorting domain-containing protein [Candidatus Cloacimonetes bacterium]|nr:T9SS type A sorting domain-containing protein [Candidatus Cloacimonadota bacterium]MDY0173063.1 FlgD immunoglobulin-like domain containing protein [Candidatus Cloacimonadaceae bacterium]
MKQITLIMLLTMSVALLSAALMWNDAVPIRQGVNIEWFRTGTDTPDGGAIYVWSDTKLGERDLWAQKVDANGNMVWGDPVLIDGKPDRQEDPVITRTSDNNFIIAWIDFSQDLDGDVFAQKINTNGELLWPVGGKPVCVGNGLQLGINMEADENGGAFIVWGDGRNPSNDLYAQRLSAVGEPLWALNGIPVANGPGDEVQNTMLPDGQGGMMMAYTHDYVNSKSLYAKRFDANGNMVWTAPLDLAMADGDQFGVRMAALSAGDFVFTWTDQRFEDPDIYAQKVNLAGEFLWPNPFIVYADQDTLLGTPAPQKNPRIQATSDNAVVIVWEDFRLGDQTADLFAQKIAANGSILWAADGIELATAEFSQIGQRMDSDNNGGVYIVWDDLRNGNTPNDDVYAQHLNSAGQAMWTPGGKAICTQPNGQNGGLIKFSGDKVFINWMDVRNGSVGLYYQVLTASGTELLEPDGKQIFWGLSGDAILKQYMILPRVNDNVVIWQDTRFANDGSRIFFQILNEDGQAMLETNGRPVTLQGGGDQEFPHAVVTDDGRTALVWVDKRVDDPNIYAQLIGLNGERLWGDNGIKLTEEQPMAQLDPKVSYHNGSFYMGWSNLDTVAGNSIYHVHGQRIVNGEKLWGANGIMISILPEAEMDSECKLAHIVGDTYIWNRVNSMSAGSAMTIWAKRVAEDGNAYPGWEDAGLQATDVENLMMQVQNLPVAAATPQGVVITWKDLRNYFLQYYAQHITGDGQRLWGDEGMQIADSGQEQEFADITVTAHGIIAAWCEIIDGQHDIRAQKFGFPGNPLWNVLGNEVVAQNTNPENPNLVSFDDNGMLLTWPDFRTADTENSDLYYDYLNNDGNLVHGNGGLLLCDAIKAQYEPKATVLNNHAYVVWADGRSGGKTEILGLYVQKLSNGTVANADLTVPGLQSPKLKQNYPNPFNPSTTIALDMPQKGEIEIIIYNTKGQLVKKLFKGELKQGTHSFSWNGQDENGNAVSSGLYFYSAQQGSMRQSRKMVLMK